MTIDTPSAIAQIDDLLARIEPAIQKSEAGYWLKGTGPERMSMRTRCVAAIERLAPRGSRYVLDATSQAILQGDPGAAVPNLSGILRALRDDYEAGYMRSVEELIHADVFADFLEMADELLSKGYKDPAAVITGSVLEEHLRKLAVVHNVAVEAAGKPRKTDALNTDLAREEVGAYNKLEQKAVTAWLDLRNKAAHGHYPEYDEPQVAGLIRDVRAFLTRHPA